MSALRSAGLGAVAVVVVWAGWEARDVSPPATAPSVVIAEMNATVPTPPLVRGEAPTVPPFVPQAAPDTRAPAAPVLRDGQVLAHGLPTALRAPVVTAAASIIAAPMPTVLPAGARPEDVVVSPAGLVTVLRVEPSPGAVDTEATSAARPRVVTRAD